MTAMKLNRHFGHLPLLRRHRHLHCPTHHSHRLLFLCLLYNGDETHLRNSPHPRDDGGAIHPRNILHCHGDDGDDVSCDPLFECIHP